MNVALPTLKPPLKLSGRSEGTFEDLRHEVGHWWAERDEDMCHDSGSSAASQHPSG